MCRQDLCLAECNPYVSRPELGGEKLCSLNTPTNPNDLIKRLTPIKSRKAECDPTNTIIMPYTVPPRSRCRRPRTFPSRDPWPRAFQWQTPERSVFVCGWACAGVLVLVVCARVCVCVEVRSGHKIMLMCICALMCVIPTLPPGDIRENMRILRRRSRTACPLIRSIAS